MILWEVLSRSFSVKADSFIRLHCSINILLRFLTAGWYIVTKGRILSLTFFFCVSADCPEAKLQLSIIFFLKATRSQALFELLKALFKCF